MKLHSPTALDVERWRRIESVLDLALELPAEDVPALLDRECAGHPALRGEIEALLEADRCAGGLMAVAAAQIVDPLADLAAALPAAIGRYQVLGTLGRGGMGVVFEAHDETLGRRVALKALPPGFAHDPARLERFLSEARLLGALQDPHLAVFHGIARQGGERYLVLERVEGATLAERLRDGALPLAEALDVMTQTAEALAAMHDYGIVHRDLKPANVMITPGGLVKLLDLGLAEASAGPAHEGSQWASAGTPGHMSPEQIAGSSQDARSDLFAWGVLAWQCLTGAHPFAAATAEARLDATLNRALDPGALPAAAPRAVCELVRRALEREAGARPAHAAEVVAIMTNDRPMPRRSRVNTPSGMAPFVGRVRELESAARLMRRAPLVTLIGTGGCGKSRLARELASSAPVLVGFAELGAAADRAGIDAAIAAAAGLRNVSGEELIEALAGTAEGWLVLDHCEDLATECAGLLVRLRERAPQLRILVTSRRPLGVPGEQTMRIAPLTLPDAESVSAAGIAASEAVQMFEACARTVQPNRVFTADERVHVAAICRLVDGVPLAIELAAARLRDELLATVAAGLAAGTRAGAGDASDAVQVAIRLSADRLGEHERRFLRALSVFRGGWDFESAAAVACPDVDRFEALDRLTVLIDRSLVVIERADRHEPRYRFLEPVRHFACSSCDAAGETGVLRARHRDVLLHTAERLAPTLTQGTAQPKSLAWLEAEHANLLAALEFEEPGETGTEKALRLAGAVWWFWYVRGHFSRGRAALARALSRPGATAPTPARALALFAAGGLAVFQGDYAEGRRLSGEAASAFGSLGDERGVARASTHLALCDGDEGRFGEAARSYERAVAIFRRLGDERRLSATLNNLGVLDRQRDDFGAAYAHHTEALALFRRADDRDGMVVTIVNLALACSRLGHATEASRHLTEALSLIGDLRARRAGAAALEVAAELRAAAGEASAAADLLGSAAALRAAIRLPADEWWRRSNESLARRLIEQLGEPGFARHHALGAERSFEQALAEATRFAAAAEGSPS